MNRLTVFLIVIFSGSLHAQFLMFPGDTNNDGIANYFDVLPIGLAYNTEGIPREIPTLDWIPQEFTPWGQNLPFSGVEFAFIDCDGNGFIDSLDVDAIAQNYDLMQLQSNPPPMPYQLPDTLFTTNIPELYVSFNVDTVFVTDTFYAEIMLVYSGPAIPEPALGLAFGLEYDPELVKDSMTTVAPHPESEDLMFVTAASNFIDFQRLPAEGRIEIGAAGRGQNVINGPRILATVMFITEDVIIRSIEKPFAFTFTDVLLINSEERVLEIGTFSDTIVVADTSSLSTHTINLQEQVTAFPNPAEHAVTLTSGDLKIAEIQVYDRLGKALRSIKAQDQNELRIEQGNLPAGIYFLKIQTDKGVLTKKISFF